LIPCGEKQNYISTEHLIFWCEDIVGLVGRLFVRLFVRGNCWDLSWTNSPTSVRRGNGLTYIRMWAILPRELVFWNGIPSPLVLMRFSGSLLFAFLQHTLGEGCLCWRWNTRNKCKC